MKRLRLSHSLWQSIHLIVITWNCLAIPFRLGFLEGFALTGPAYNVVFFVLDIGADIFIAADVVLRHLVFNKMEKARLSALVLPEITKSSRYSSSASKLRLLRHEIFHVERQSRYGPIFAKGFMLVVDIASALPVDLFVYFVLSGQSADALLWRLPKLLQFLQLWGAFKVLFAVLERRRIIVNAGFHRLIYLWTVFTLCAHWMSCGFYSLGAAAVARGNAEDSWVIMDGLLKYQAVVVNGTTMEGAGMAVPVLGVTVAQLYIRSVYWSVITMVTVGLGDIYPAKSSASETAFTLCTMYLGMALTSCVIGNLTNLVANLDAAEDQFHNKMDNLNKYMAYRHLSTELRDRIRAYYTYMWTSLHGVDENEFLKDLPATLKLQVAGLQSKDLVKQVPFLRKAKPSIINAICVALEQVIVSPGDNVVRKGQTMQGCFWLRRGEAEVLAPGNSVISTMTGKSSAFFGEASLFFAGNFENDVRAKSYCEFFFLRKGKFVEILSESLTHDEYLELEEKAEKAGKRNAKVKKFFGLDTNVTQLKGWRLILEPKSRFREVWNIVGLVAALYMSINVPYRLATETMLNSGEARWTSYILDWVFDLQFGVDVVLRAFYFAFIREGIVVRDRSTIFANYIATASWVTDIFLLVPFDLLAAVFGHSVLPLCRISKLFWLSFLMRHYDVAQAYFAGRRMTLTNAMHRIIKIFIGVILFVHFLGCGWMIMSGFTRWSSIQDNPDALAQNAANGNCKATQEDWVCHDDLTWNQFGIDHSQPGVTYLRAIYFVLVDMTTVGYGDLVPKNTHETGYVVFITLFGGLMYPAVVGAMAALISSLDTTRADFKRKLVTLIHYMSTKNFPRDLRIRINRYYDYLWSRQRGVDEQMILNDLPFPLRMEVQAFINGEIMRNITFLQGVDNDLLHHLFSVLTPSVFLPDDMIIIAGELGQDMYLLERGATRVTSKDGKMTYAVLTPGDYFGEASLLTATTRTASVIAIGYCDCFVLNKDNFDHVTNSFPHQRKKVLAKLEQTLEKKKQDNHKLSENVRNYPKLSTITSYEYAKRKSIGDASWRHPDSFRRRLWDVLVLLAVIYNLTAIPFRIALESSIQSYFVDFVLDMLLITDAILRFCRLGYVDEGQVYTDVEDIKENYRKSRVFLRDLLVCIPLDLLVLIVLVALRDVAPRSSLLLVMALLRVFKLLTLARVSTLMGNLDSLFNQSRFSSYDVMYKLFKLIVTVVIISHWAACLFYFEARYGSGGSGTSGPEGSQRFSWDECERLYGHSDQLHGNLTAEEVVDNGCPAPGFFDTLDKTTSELSCGLTELVNCYWDGTWIEYQIQTGFLPQEGGDIWWRYLRALNWALPTLVVVVIGDTVPVTFGGTLYVTVGIIIGVTINAAIIGSIANLVANLEGSIAMFRAKMDKFEQFMYLYNIPKQLQNRTRNYLEYLWFSDQSIAQAHLVEDMPATLRTEVSNFLKLTFIEQCVIFAECDKALQKDIASKLVQKVYSPMDYIVFEGDIGTEMYFIERGMVQVLSFRDAWRADHRDSVGSCVTGSNGRRASLTSNGNSCGLGKLGSISANAGKKLRMFSARMSESRASMMSTNINLGDDDVIVLATLESGSFFGETAIFFNERRSCSVRAVDFIELFALSKSDLDDVLMRFPHNEDHLFRMVSDLRKNNIVRNSNVHRSMEGIIDESKRLGMVRHTMSSASRSIKNMFRMHNGSISDMIPGPRSAKVVAMDNMVNENALKRAQGLKENDCSLAPSTSATSLVTDINLYNQSPNRSTPLEGVTPSAKSNQKLARTLIMAEKSLSNNNLMCDGMSALDCSTNGGAHRAHCSAATTKITQRKGHKPLLFKPSSTFYRVWNMLSLGFTLFMVFSIPYRVVFYVDGLHPFKNHTIPLTVWLYFGIEYAMDVFFIVDLFLRYNCFAINRFGKLITDRVDIAANYRREWFTWDLVSCVPLDVIAWASLLQDDDENNSMILLLSCTRLVRLVRLVRMGYYTNLYDQYLNEARANSAVVQTSKIVLLTLLLNHFYACTWFSIHRFIENDVHNTWAIADGLASYNETTGVHNVYHSDLTPQFAYLRSLYFTVTTMSSVGYGDIRPYTFLETVHELMVVITGACTFAALIGSVAVIFLHWDSKGDISFKGRLRKLIHYMQFRELPADLQQEIVNYFTLRWERFEGVKLCDVIVELPLPLQLELSLTIHAEIFCRVRGLRRCHIHVQRHIARLLRVQVSASSDYVYREGEIGNDIYFVLHGQLELTSKVKKERILLQPGQHFGGETLYSVSGERNESIQCLEDCELYLIKKDEFEQLVFEFPEHRNVGIFAELMRPGHATIRQTKELRKQVQEIVGNVKNSPLATLSSKHIDAILNDTDLHSIIENMHHRKKAPVLDSVAGELEVPTGLGVSATAKLVRMLSVTDPDFAMTILKAMPKPKNQSDRVKNVEFEKSPSIGSQRFKNHMKDATNQSDRTSTLSTESEQPDMDPINTIAMARHCVLMRLYTSEFRGLDNQDEWNKHAPKLNAAEDNDRRMTKARPTMLTRRDNFVSDDGKKDVDETDKTRDRQASIIETAFQNKEMNTRKRLVAEQSVTFEDAIEFMHATSSQKLIQRVSHIDELNDLKP